MHVVDRLQAAGDPAGHGLRGASGPISRPPVPAPPPSMLPVRPVSPPSRSGSASSTRSATPASVTRVAAIVSAPSSSSTMAATATIAKSEVRRTISWKDQPCRGPAAGMSTSVMISDSASVVLQ